MKKKNNNSNKTNKRVPICKYALDHDQESSYSCFKARLVDSLALLLYLQAVVLACGTIVVCCIYICPGPPDTAVPKVGGKMWQLCKRTSDFPTATLPNCVVSACGHVVAIYTGSYIVAVSSLCTFAQDME